MFPLINFIAHLSIFFIFKMKLLNFHFLNSIHLILLLLLLVSREFPTVCYRYLAESLNWTVYCYWECFRKFLHSCVLRNWSKALSISTISQLAFSQAFGSRAFSISTISPYSFISTFFFSLFCVFYFCSNVMDAGSSSSLNCNSTSKRPLQEQFHRRRKTRENVRKLYFLWLLLLFFCLKQLFWFLEFGFFFLSFKFDFWD